MGLLRVMRCGLLRGVLWRMVLWRARRLLATGVVAIRCDLSMHREGTCGVLFCTADRAYHVSLCTVNEGAENLRK